MVPAKDGHDVGSLSPSGLDRELVVPAPPRRITPSTEFEMRPLHYYLAIVAIMFLTMIGWVGFVGAFIFLANH